MGHFLLPIQRAHWVETHSTNFLACHHLDNVEQKQSILKY